MIGVIRVSCCWVVTALPWGRPTDRRHHRRQRSAAGHLHVVYGMATSHVVAKIAPEMHQYQWRLLVARIAICLMLCKHGLASLLWGCVLAVGTAWRLRWVRFDWRPYVMRRQPHEPTTPNEFWRWAEHLGFSSKVRCRKITLKNGCTP